MGSNQDEGHLLEVKYKDFCTENLRHKHKMSQVYVLFLAMFHQVRKNQLTPSKGHF